MHRQWTMDSLHADTRASELINNLLANLYTLLQRVGYSLLTSRQLRHLLPAQGYAMAALVHTQVLCGRACSC